ncbi:MAG: energy-coupling factor transporter transmembrane protein EcfT [Calditerrivibrio sp.]|nr:energy-coupling factor transporter transmembrane protein EcfT [Calditerrivibrio sp.]
MKVKQFDPLSILILFLSIVIYAFINKRLDHFIVIDTILVAFILVVGKKVLKHLLFILFITVINVSIVFINIDKRVIFDFQQFTLLLFRTVTMILALVVISNSLTFKGFLTILVRLKLPKTLLELTAISFLAVSILNNSAKKIITAMKSRNLFSNLTLSTFATGIFPAVLFRTMLSDIKKISLVTESRSIESFYPLLIDEYSLNRFQLCTTFTISITLIAFGILSNG